MARSLLAPDGYRDRCSFAVAALPGPDPNRARLLGCEPPTVVRIRAREKLYADTERLAEVVGVPVALLVYGPTEELKEAVRARWGEPVDVRVGRPRTRAETA